MDNAIIEMTAPTQDQLNQQLFKTVYVNDIEGVKQAIQDGANVNAGDEEGITSLHWVAFTEYTEIAKLLLEKGALVNIEDDNGATPLQWAKSINVETLLKQQGGVDGNDEDDDHIQIRDGFEGYKGQMNDKDDFDEDACYERDIKWAESMSHDEIDEDDDFDEDAYYEQEIEMAEYMLEINDYYENKYAA